MKWKDKRKHHDNVKVSSITGWNWQLFRTTLLFYQKDRDRPDGRLVYLVLCITRWTRPKKHQENDRVLTNEFLYLCMLLQLLKYIQLQTKRQRILFLKNSFWTGNIRYYKKRGWVAVVLYYQHAAPPGLENKEHVLQFRRHGILVEMSITQPSLFFLLTQKNR